MGRFNVGDKVKVRKGQEKVSDFTSTKNKLFPGEYTILRVLGDFVSIDFDKPDFLQSRFELIPSKLDGIGEGDVVKVSKECPEGGDVVSAFKVGDRVRGIWSKGTGQADVIGKVGKITEPSETWSWVIWDDGGKRDVHYYNLELIKKEEKVTKFKIGDRVRALDSVQLQILKGAIGTVTDIAYPENAKITLYGIDGVRAIQAGNWAHHFELVTDDIKVGDYVSIDKTDIYGPLAKGTVESITPSEPVVLVRSDSGQTYARKPSELTPAVKPDPIPAEPAHNTAFKFDNSGLTWVWDKTGWSWLDYNGSKSGNNESWASLWGRYVGRHDKRKTFTVL